MMQLGQDKVALPDKKRNGAGMVNLI